MPTHIRRSLAYLGAPTCLQTKISRSLPLTSETASPNRRYPSTIWRSPKPRSSNQKSPNQESEPEEYEPEESGLEERHLMEPNLEKSEPEESDIQAQNELNRRSSRNYVGTNWK